MQIILVRHGQSEALAGQSDDVDSGLTPLGLAQAGALAAALAPEGLTDASLRTCGGIVCLINLYKYCSYVGFCLAFLPGAA
jgi:hypothetical protein